MVGYAWFKRMFIVSLRKEAEADARFVQATVKGNASVNKENLAILKALTGGKRRAWLSGD